ncbi:MAG: low specificity L-threonine aldolase, partial [Geminicoccaceae bacterium]
LVHPVEANELFVAMPEPLVAELHRDGFQFHRWSSPADPGPPVVRLVTSFATGEAEVDALLEAAAGIAAA